MTITLDHVFMLVEPGAKVADRLLEQGFREGQSNTHPGQGTANRRFYFANGMLEFIWVHDADEARNGPGQNLLFAERAEDLTASPFGAIFVPRPSGPSKSGTNQNSTTPDFPFPGWHYQPAYFPAPTGFHVGANSHNIAEPLCFYFPLQAPGIPKPQPHRNPQMMSKVIISTPSTDTEGVLALASQTDRLSIQTDQEHRLEITLDRHTSGHTEDFRPAMPLILHW